MDFRNAAGKIYRRHSGPGGERGEAHGFSGQALA
jgi:hypothetical protein